MATINNIKQKKKKFVLKLLEDKEKQDFVDYLQTIPFYFSEDVLLDEADLKNFAYNDYNHYVIAKYQNEIIGHIAIQYQKYKYGYHQEHIAEIHINVKQEHQKKGIGKQLMKYCLDYLKTKKEINKIKTKILENNKIIQQLFSNFKFQQEAILKKEWKIIIKEKEYYLDGIYMSRFI